MKLLKIGLHQKYEIEAEVKFNNLVEEHLPMPLGAEQEAEALKGLAAGNPESKTLLIERNLRLVVYIARKFDNTGVDLEDLISVGTIGLIKAVNSFDTEKNIKLATYASRCIENEILMYLRRYT